MAFTMKKGSKDLGHGADGDTPFSNKQVGNMGGVTFASPAAKSGILKTDDKIKTEELKEVVVFGKRSGKRYKPSEVGGTDSANSGGASFVNKPDHEGTVGN